MRNLMMLRAGSFSVRGWRCRSFAKTGLWGALLVHYAARGGLQALPLSGAGARSFPRSCCPAETQGRGQCKCNLSVAARAPFGRPVQHLLSIAGERVNFLIDCGASSLPA